MIKSRIAKLDGHMQEVMKGAFSALTFRVFGAVLSFGMNLVLARMLGASGSGVFYLAFMFVSIGSVVGRIGLDNVMLRRIARSSVDERWGEVASVYGRGMLISVIASLVVFLILFGLTNFISIELLHTPDLEKPLYIMSFAIVPLSLVMLHAESLKGLKKISHSQFIQGVVIPAIVLPAIVILVPMWGVGGAAIAYLLSVCTALLISVLFWRRVIHKVGEICRVGYRELLEPCFPLLMVSLLNLVMIWMPTLALGIWASPEDVGIYNMASRTATLISFVLIAVNAISAPKFAAFFHKNDICNLEKTAKSSAKIVTLAASPMLLLFIIFPDLVMSMFGHEFVKASSALVILSIGQFVNVLTGSVGMLLIMTGHEKLLRNNMMVSAAICSVLSALLVPSYGWLGAAEASSLAMIIMNMISVFLVYSKLDIWTIPWTSFIVRR